MMSVACLCDVCVDFCATALKGRATFPSSPQSPFLRLITLVLNVLDAHQFPRVPSSKVPMFFRNIRTCTGWISVHFRSDLQAETERKSYDSCLDHADELQALADKLRSLEVLTTTQLSETDRAIYKAPSLPVGVAVSVYSLL